jgi:aryl sulfotransferase
VNGRILWLASYPKSGNTWLRAVLSAFQSDEPARLEALDGDSIAARTAFDELLGMPSSVLTPDEVDILRPRVDELLAAESEGPLLRKTHDALRASPSGEPVLSITATRAAIYMVRDPRDVTVSLAHHSGRDVDWAVDRLADPRHALGNLGRSPAIQLRQRLGTWTQHVCGWVDDAPFPVHVLRYEDCLDDPVTAFATALASIDLDPVGEDRLARAIESAAFERLRDAETASGFAERPASAKRFFRNGRSGSWREEMSHAAVARLEAAHGETMQRFGYA